MSTRYGHTKQVTKGFPRCCYALSILKEYAKSMLRVWVEYAKGITGFPSPCALSVGGEQRALRYARMIVVMLVMGGGEIWGQDTDYSGTWYIASGGNSKESGGYTYSSSTPANNFYLVPTCDPVANDKSDVFHDNTADEPQEPFLTTYKIGHDNEAVWVLKQVTDDDGTFYYVIHVMLGKYVVYDPYFQNYTDPSTDNTWRRKCMHLQASSDDENTKFVIGERDGAYYFIPKVFRNLTPGKGKPFIFWNIADGNKNSRQGQGSNYWNGLVGLYGLKNEADELDVNSRWKFETALLAAPTITVDSENSTFTITADFMPPNCSIRYTIGDGTQDAPTATTGYVYTEAVFIDDFTNVKAVIVGYDMLLSAVANTTVKCDIPSLTSYDATDHSVILGTATPGATIYYTSVTDDSDPEDPTTSTYSGYGESPLTIEDVDVTTKFKAIAVKEGMAYSDVYSQTMVVDQTITLSSSSFAYTGQEIEPTVSINDGDIPNTEFEVSFSNNVNAGTATATITNKPGGNYYVIGGSVNFEITEVPLKITANPHTITYGDEPAGNGVTYKGFVDSEDESDLTGTLEYAYSYTQYGDVGTYSITPSGLSSTNYDITFEAGTLTVTPKEVGLTWGGTDLTYSGISQVPTATATETVNDDEIGVTVSGGQTDVGTGYIATASALTGDKAGNYKLPEANTTTFTIGKAPLTVTAVNNTITYGDAPAGNGVTYSPFVNGETAESVLTGTPKYYFNYAQYEDVGDYVITPYDLTATNYDITFETGTLTVTPKEVGVTWEETTLTYNGSAQTPTATATGTVNGDVIDVTVTGGQTDAGETVHTATASALTGDKAGNYKLPESVADKTTTFTIDPAPLTVTANDHTIIYGAIPANNGVTYTGFATGDDESTLSGTPTYAYNYTQFGDVGTYDITPSGLSSTNYDITFKTGTLTVTPKEVRITWGETALTYNGAAQVPTATITYPDDIVNDDEVDNDIAVTPSANTGSSLTGVSAINPGYYRATASFTGDDAANYKPVPEIQPFSISSKIIGDGNEAAEGITITFDPDKVENGDVNGIVSSVTDGETTLSTDDYTVEIITQGFDNYIKVSGVGNYGGSVQKLLVKPEFYLYTEPEETADYAAVYRASSDLSKPAGLTPYIVSKVNPSIGTISITEVKYLPKDVPVLMLSASDVKGFLASSKPAESVDHISEITAETENSNLLKVAPEGGVTVEDAQVYMFYQGEFVLTKEGTISEGKFYLNNPNYKATSNPAGSRSVLRFVVGDDTGIIDIEMSEDSRTASGNDAWYSLDGRRLSGRPTKQGLYIWNGRKTVINKK